MERLFGYPAPAGLWESDLLPARCEPYYLAWLDSLLQESDLLWFGCGRERISFALASDLELFSAPAAEPEVDSLFPGEGNGGRYRFEELLESSGLDRRQLARRLWESVWHGEVSNTTLLALRQAAIGRFEPPERKPPEASGPRRRRLERWGLGRPLAGDWYRLSAAHPREELDALDREELARDRVRQLLDRYGVVFRELLARELPALRWGRLFASLRMLELAGEVVSGQFFEGVPGPQFASPSALRRLRSGLSDDAVYWMNALDPASPCGLGLEGLRGKLPARRPSNHLVFQGSRLVVASRRNGGRLEIEAEPEHPLLPEYLSFLRVLLTRQFQPLKEIRVERVNDRPADASPYAPPLAEMFDLTREPGRLRLRRRYGAS
jgi:ATP-dependent Lhr-like helicase